MHKAVVLGARFGGSATAYWLHKLFARDQVQVTVVDQWALMTYRPSLVMAAAGHPPMADQWHIAMKQRCETAGQHFIRDTIFRIDPERQLVYLATHPPLSYDTLFIATGSDPGWTSIAGLSPAIGGVCEDYLARETGARMRDSFSSIALCVGPLFQSPTDSPRLAGSLDAPAFEVAFLLDAWFRKQRRRDQVTMTIVTPAAVPGEFLGPKSQELLSHALAQRRIHLITNAQYDHVSALEIFFKNKKPLHADKMIWVPPYVGSELARISGIDDGYGWIPVDEYCMHQKWPNIYAVGDISTTALPKIGHMAMLQARNAVHHFYARQHKKKPSPVQPYVLHVGWMGRGIGLLTLSDWLYGGSRELVHIGVSSALAKAMFNHSYKTFSGWLPIMP